MPRKNRSYERGGCYHITHRCHGRHYWHRQAIEQKLQCDKLERKRYWGTAVAVGDPEWLAEYVQGRKLKLHRIIEAGAAHYIKRTGGEAAKKLKSKKA